MRIVIDGPVFHGQSDEDHLFEWMSELPSFEKVVGVGTQLQVYLREPVDDDTVLGLIVLCDRWRIDMTPLRGESAWLTTRPPAEVPVQARPCHSSRQAQR